MIAFLSDIHGHLAALEAVLADARRRGARRFVCLGDVESNACLDRLAEVGAICVFGNWEVSGWLRCAPHHQSWIRTWPPVWAEDSWVAAHASPDWPPEANTVDATAVYQSQSGLYWLDLFPPMHRDAWARRRALAVLEAMGARVAFHGHTHVQEAWRWKPGGQLERILSSEFQVPADGSRYLVGVGSVGNPRDGRGACYALWDPAGRVILVRLPV
ncbi:MAG: metallophosphoesterase family protein [Anaerolineae bacterium]|nr:metallophosphatase family protein [Anaerolineae bacterium]MDW8098551.1 metallophosphoesterase family protein [Anaerolineae bacterium]